MSILPGMNAAMMTGCVAAGGGGGSWQTVFGPYTAWNYSTGSSGFTYLSRIEAAKFSAVSGNTCRITIAGNATSGNFEAWFGRAAASGDLYDFAASPAPVQLLQGGSTAISWVNGDILTDEVSFAFDPAFAHIVALYVNSGSNAFESNNSDGDSDLARWFRSGNHASTVDKASFTADTSEFSFWKTLEVFG